MQDWEIKPLKDICSIFTDGNWIETKDQSDEGIRLIQTGNIGFGYYKDKSDKSRYISEETFKQLKCTEILPGDLLVSRLPDPVGKSCLIPDINTKMITGVDCTIIRLKEIVIPKYLLYYQMSQQYLKDVESKVSGTTRSRISRKNLGLINIPFPKNEKQKQIVGILDKAFKSIEQAKANIEKNIQNTKELFQSRLNEMFSQKGDGWEEKTLGEVCNLFQGLAINKKTKHLLVEKSSLPLLRIKDLKNNTYEQYVSEEGFPINSLVNEKEIIYTRTGNSLGLVFRGKRGILHNNSFKIIPSDELENDYLYWWLQHDKFTKKIIKLASKAAQPDITHKLFKQQAIVIPSKDKQKEYYLEIVKLDKLTKQLEKQYQQKLKNLEELKKSILQKAFSGELIP